MRLKTLGKSPVRVQKFTDHGPNTGFYEPQVDQSECRMTFIDLELLQEEPKLTLFILDSSISSKLLFLEIQ